MSDSKRLVDLFTAKAKLVSAVVTPVKSLDEALAYTVDVCEKKDACQILMSGCESELSAPAGALCDTKPGKVIVAPDLDPAVFASLKGLCENRGIHCLPDGMRKHLGGIDIGFTIADAGIAETGTLLINSKSEELRLATMLCEVHVCVIKASTLRETSFDAEELVRSMSKDGPAYVAFVTGASRTADIERVLAIGVHGPLELHILVLED
ncbi:MAG TPA: lactate utilization protein [Humidesulfovibrio sp.]|uniref:LutC/YkgG family protein n=1 Tax=Humidesulfovibrio sp. TaxID=2910988 RepID=UPI002CADDA32|nr:lactate utilization protein [Humidesulfovibrio sp.]HWR02916.1 lactate utilization protein [Humidesulfovibrio sp.]